MDMFWTGVVLCGVSVAVLMLAVVFWSSLYKEAYNLGFDTHRQFGHLHPRLRLTLDPPSDEAPYAVEGTLLEIERERDAVRYIILQDNGNEYKVFAEFVKKAEMVTPYETL